MHCIGFPAWTRFFTKVVHTFYNQDSLSLQTTGEDTVKSRLYALGIYKDKGKIWWAYILLCVCVWGGGGGGGGGGGAVLYTA